MTSSQSSSGSRGVLILAFVALYIVWGSTYLAIRIAIETLPPFLMSGARFVLAGATLYAWGKLRGAPTISRGEWRGAAIVGAFLLLGGNGLVVWSEQRIPSGIAALLVGITPFWMTLLDWLWLKSHRPTPGTIAGLLIGFAGLAILIGPQKLSAHDQPVDLVGAGTVLLAALSWSVGSLYSRRLPKTASPIFNTGAQMIAGGTLLLIAGLATGETSLLHPGAFSTRSLLALGYLYAFGSLVGFSAYIYVLGHTTPARASTYAYVNPLVAVVLGWALAGEPLTTRTVVAAALIIAAVVAITTLSVRQNAPVETETVS
ncbi:MAG: EamA family transporter [Candidatus Sumerlaeaceae bacterium]|nr:EamA family transporter [Candidatus Sumerlaeaceae bacterium]